MWKLGVISALIMTSFRLAVQQNLNDQGCGQYGPHDVENGQIDLKNGAAQHGELPWMVMVMLHWSFNINGKLHEHNSYLSDGVLIHRQAVLVSIYGLYGKPKGLLVRAGGFWDTASNSLTNSTQERGVKNTIFHKYQDDKPMAFQHLVVILILSSPFVLDNNVAVVCLPRKNVDRYDSSRCIGSGWSVDSVNIDQSKLERRSSPIFSHDKCNTSYEDYNNNCAEKVEILRDSICAGDEKYPRKSEIAVGGALICPSVNETSRYFLVGIEISRFQCATYNSAHLPSQFADVSAARDWIEAQILEKGL